MAVLSFDMTDATKMDGVWPTISDRALLGVNQRWAGHPGTRVAVGGADGGSEWQGWAKPLGQRSHAAFLLSAGEAEETTVSVAFEAISADLAAAEGVRIWDLYQDPPRAVTPSPIDPRAHNLTATLGAHDSAFFCTAAVGSLMADAKAGSKSAALCRAAAAAGGCPVT